MLVARASLAALALAALSYALLALPSSGRAPGPTTATVAAGFELATPRPGTPVLRHPQGRTTAKKTSSAVAGRIPNDPHFAESWALQSIRAPLAWQTTTGSPAIVVAVLDTGVDGNQPDLVSAIVPGVNLVAGAGEPHDDHGHGTLVAGVIAARGDNGTGATGICWTCSIMPVKVVGSDGRGSAAAIAAGIRWAVDHGAHVINLSLVLSGPDGEVADAVRYALDRGLVVVSAAGNTASTSPVYPAAESGVVGVAAVDQLNVPFSWTGRGAWVRVAAPGCALTTAVDGSYPTFCGTSAATAVVSGLAALALSARPELTGVDVARALESGALPLGELVATGRVDAASTLGLVAG
jgi:subtilisin family serine protease